MTATALNIAEQLFPRPSGQPAPEYREHLRIRERILSVIREESHQKTKFVDDLVQALLDHDMSIPTDPISIALAALKIGKRANQIKKRREIYKTVINSLLEQIFDPILEFKMWKKDILDCFHSNGISRDTVSNDQIEQIYVRVIQKMKVGELRDLTFEEQLSSYVRLKLDEIGYSRRDWELNGR